jgi:peptide/nickel transport system permease protein
VAGPANPLLTPVGVEGARVAYAPPSTLVRLARNPVIVFGIAVLALIVAVGIAAPWLTDFDPVAISPASRNQVSGAVETVRADDGRKTEVRHWMGTDSLGRDVASRVFYGARVSLFVGIAVAVIAIVIGVAIGVVAGYFRRLDGVIMRVMDGLMAIPAILLAIALVSISTAGVAAVIVAIVVPEVPRVVRLVRAVVLSVREEPYVEAAIAGGTRTPALIVRHILPSTYSPLIVQATYICATAILVEAILSFLGVGIPPQTPTWGNIMSEGRALFRVYPHNVLWPGLFVALTVLSINVLGDGLRDSLDPRMRKQL